MTISRDEQIWQELGFSQELYRINSECSSFLLRSRVIYSMALFQNHSGQEQLVMQNSRVFVKIESSWVAFDESRLLFDRESERIHDSENNVYNYIWPEGFIKKSPFLESLYPVFQTKAHQASFQYQLQLVTYKKAFFSDCASNRSFNKYMPLHTSLRLIANNERLYSFGIEFTPESKKFITITSLFATVKSKVVSPDWCETRPYEKRYITTFEIDERQFQSVSDYVEKVSSGKGSDISPFQDNCTGFTSTCLQKAGITIDSKMKATTLFYKLFVPKTVRKVIQVVCSIFQKVLPQFLYQGLSVTCQKVATIAANLFIYMLGGGKKMPEAKKPLFDGVLECFFKESPQVDHSRLLQKAQKTTFKDKTESTIYSGVLSFTSSKQP